MWDGLTRMACGETASGVPSTTPEIEAARHYLFGPAGLTGAARVWSRDPARGSAGGPSVASRPHLLSREAILPNGAASRRPLAAWRSLLSSGSRLAASSWPSRPGRGRRRKRSGGLPRTVGSERHSPLAALRATPSQREGRSCRSCKSCPCPVCYPVIILAAPIPTRDRAARDSTARPARGPTRRPVAHGRRRSPPRFRIRLLATSSPGDP